MDFVSCSREKKKSNFTRQ